MFNMALLFVSPISCSPPFTLFTPACPPRFTSNRRGKRHAASHLNPRCASADDDPTISKSASSSSPPPPPPLSDKPISASGSPPKPQTRKRRVSKNATAFETTIDNMTMKRMGRGTIYYGEKAVAEDDAPTFLAADQFEEEVLKPNSVLVLGGTGQTGLWITLGLLNQGFNVRVMSRSFSRAETLFGPSGSNVDVFEGNVSNLDDVRAATDGAEAVVYAASPSPVWFPPAVTAVDVQGVQNVVAAAAQSSTAIRRIVLVSADGNSAMARSKRRGEDIIRESSIPYAIIRAAPLSGAEGGLRVVDMQPVVDGKDGSDRNMRGKSLSRIDAAQCVCQALVQHRRLEEMAAQDPDAGFEFPSCTFTANNSEELYVPDKRFWINAFSRISNAFRPNEAETT